MTTDMNTEEMARFTEIFDNFSVYQERFSEFVLEWNSSENGNCIKYKMLKDTISDLQLKFYDKCKELGVDDTMYQFQQNVDTKELAELEAKIDEYTNAKEKLVKPLEDLYSEYYDFDLKNDFYINGKICDMLAKLQNMIWHTRDIMHSYLTSIYNI